jgi:hypothetical protein
MTVATDPPDGWDTFIQDCAEWDFEQTQAYGRLRADEGCKTAWVTAYDRDQRVGSALFVREPDAWLLWKGPCARSASSELLAAILIGAPRSERVRLVLEHTWVDAATLEAVGFRPAGVFSTSLVATHADTEVLLARMKPATRSRVRRATRANVTVSADNSSFAEYWPVYAQVMHREGSPDFATCEHLERLLCYGDAQLFAARCDGTVVAGSICYRHSDSLESRYVATSTAGRQIGALNLVHLYTTVWAAQHGMAHLDLGGIAHKPLDTKTAAINRFKLGFGGHLVSFPTFIRA